MEIGRPKGCTRVIGKSQGYFGLPVRDVLLNDSVSGPGTPAMQTVWMPSPDELALLNAGAPILLTVLGTAHPPVMIGCGDLPDEVRQMRADVQRSAAADLFMAHNMGFLEGAGAMLRLVLAEAPPAWMAGFSARLVLACPDGSRPGFMALLGEAGLGGGLPAPRMAPSPEAQMVRIKAEVGN